MAGLFRRLLASTVAYQAPSIVSSLLALVTIRLYTGRLMPAEYGYAETLLTVTLTVVLVVVARSGARGYVLGNYAASTVVLAVLWIAPRDRVSVRPPRGLRALLAFGAPTVPADAAAFALNVVDRQYVLHA